MPEPDRILRDRLDALNAALGTLPDPDGSGTSSVLVRTVEEATYPQSASASYACVRVLASGDEAEGSTPTLADTEDRFYVYNLGSAVPPAGTYMVAHGVGGRWAFRFDGGGS